MSEIKQPNVSIYASVPLTTMLMDGRMGHYGHKFGTVEDVCRQYGVTCTKHPNCIEFSAPKLRISLFLEKLHFSRTRYSKRLF